MVVIPTVVTLEPQVDSGSLRPVGSAEPGADFFSLFLFSALSSLGEGEGEAPEKSSAQEKSSVLDEPGQTDVLSASQTGATPFVFPFLLFNFSAPAVGAVPPTGQAGDLQVASSQGIDTQPVPQAPPALPEPVPQVYQSEFAPALPGQAPAPLQGDVPRTSSEAVPQVPTEDIRQLPGFPAVHQLPGFSLGDQRPPSLPVITGAESSAPAPFPSRPPLPSGSPSAEQPSLGDEERKGLGVPLARLLEANGRTAGLAAAPLLPAGNGNRPAEDKEDGSALSSRLLTGEGQGQTLRAQSLSTPPATPGAPRPAETWQAVLVEEPVVPAGKTLTPVAQKSPEVSSLAAERLFTAQLSPGVTTDLRSHGLAEQGEAEQEDGPVHPAGDKERKGLGVPLARLLEANGRTAGLAAAPLLPAGNGNRPAEDKEDGSALSSRLLTGEGQGQTLRAQLLSTPPATPGAPRPAETWQAVLVQVVGGVSASLRQNSQEARIQLEPPELGKLKIELVLEGGRVHARIIAESAEVGALIQNHLPELKQALQSHSLDLDTVRVDVNSGGGEQGDFSRGFQQDLGARGGRGGPNAFSQWAEKDAGESSSSTRSGPHGGVSVWA